MNNKKNSKKSKNFISNSDTLGIFEGLDIAINFSILPFMAFFYFDFLDYKTAILLTLSIICISFLVRFFLPFIGFSLQKIIRYTKKPFFFILIFSLYFSQILVLNTEFFLYLNILIFILTRIAVGFFFSTNNILFLNFFNGEQNDFYKIKYFLMIIIGIFLGLFFSSIVNEIYSNNQLNEWAWKVTYLPLIIFIPIIYIFNKSNFRSYGSVSSIEMLSSRMNFSLVIRFFLRNLIIVMPLIFLFLFCFNDWLPGTVYPENMFFSEIKLVHIIFLFIICIFSNLVFQLIGKNRSFLYFSVFSILISLSLFFYSDNKSSYSINSIHFFISFISAFSISLFFYEISNIKNKIALNSINVFYSLNFIYLCIFLLLPITVYFLLYFILKYNIIYLLTAFIFMISLTSSIYFKKKDNN